MRAHIWIIGHSMVHWARVRAINSSLGPHLSYINISWISRRGMRWAEMLPAIRARAAAEGPPDALVIQLGEKS